MENVAEILEKICNRNSHKTKINDAANNF